MARSPKDVAYQNFTSNALRHVLTVIARSRKYTNHINVRQTGLQENEVLTEAFDSPRVLGETCVVYIWMPVSNRFL